VISPSNATTSNDVVSPSKLLTLARERFDVALRVIGTSEATWVPTALSASVGIREATSGIGTLQSVLVPSTPWGIREIAAGAMNRAKQALTLLEQYRMAMGPRGDGSFNRTDLAVRELALIDGARSNLRSAVLRVPA
jgi:non-canonical (house-cleaning) NTP pyrophosphatase